jgi:serine/tyrosine/threonine adenylyltransferase
MNTDNMSILGLSIDYGPFSFLDHYDLNFTPNTTDLPGRRYAFGNQASIAYWNLGKLASAISLLFDDTSELEDVLNSYESYFWTSYYGMMGKKLGLDEVTSEDRKLISEFERVLSIVQPDMTIFYRLLADVPNTTNEEAILKHFKACFYEVPEGEKEKEIVHLLAKYIKRLKDNSIPSQLRKKIMNRNNPRIILRNYLLHQAIEELEKGEDHLFRQLEKALKDPYSATDFEELVAKRPDWASQKAGCSMLSCSS